MISTGKNGGTVSHSCKGTCSGWDDGFKQGQEAYLAKCKEVEELKAKNDELWADKSNDTETYFEMTEIQKRLEAQLKAYEAALRVLCNSMRPSPVEHPSMFQAKRDAEILLNENKEP